jgi:hypothetical protein
MLAMLTSTFYIAQTRPLREASLSMIRVSTEHVSAHDPKLAILYPIVSCTIQVNKYRRIVKINVACTI